MRVAAQGITDGLRSLGVAGQVICVHSSLRSFGPVAGGADAVIDGVLAADCTLLAPTFSDAHEVRSPPGAGYEGNAYGDPLSWPSDAPPFSPGSTVIDRDMGAIPAAVLGRSDRQRGDHPLCSFAAVGAYAGELVQDQSALDVYGPLRALSDAAGWVVLMGVGLTSMTLVHLAERQAGRNLFRRWGKGSDGTVWEVECGGCSLGFGKLAPVLEPLKTTATVGQSDWIAYPALEALNALTAAILAQPKITHCGRTACRRCDDMAAGGPLLPPST